MPSQSDVARKARVSFMTVSRVVNNRGNVKEATRQKVLEAIEELNYYPNAAARALNMDRSFGVGISVPQSDFIFAAPFYPALILELERSFRKKGFHLVFDSLERGDETDYRAMFHQRKVDGVVIISPRKGEPQLESLVRENIPAVVLYGNPERNSIPYIDVDSTGGIKLLMGELKRLKHSRVGFIKGEEGLPMAGERLQAYLTARNEFGMDEDKDLVFQGDWSAKSGAEGFRSLFNLSEPPTAVLCANDLMALGFMQAAFKNGMKIPEDVSVGGFNGADFSPYLTPPLTTLGQPIYSVAHAAAEVLVPRMMGDIVEIDKNSEKRTLSQAKLLAPKPYWRESFATPRDKSIIL
ncbi:MAG: LacI family DNA-binding transcriptional regulator [Spirochaetales bacterium]|nr:LacI family DNA-binding transcriptional regulator [Spirochaetales bacterium]